MFEGAVAKLAGTAYNKVCGPIGGLTDLCGGMSTSSAHTMRTIGDHSYYGIMEQSGSCGADASLHHQLPAPFPSWQGEPIRDPSEGQFIHVLRMVLELQETTEAREFG